MGRRKRVAAILMALVVVAGIGIGVAATRNSTTAGHGQRAGPSTSPVAHPSILFFGDSISANWYATTPAQGYREVFTAQIHGTEAGFLGGPGQTIGQVLVQTPGAAQTSADIAVVELGTNDLFQAVPLTSAQQSYEQLLAAARRMSASHAQLFCIGLWEEPSLAQPYDTVLQQLCTATGGHWVAISDLYNDLAYHGPAGTPTFLGPSDEYHPNDAGHRAIAERLLAAVRAARP